MNDAAITNLFVAENNKIAGVIFVIRDCLRAGDEPIDLRFSDSAARYIRSQRHCNSTDGLSRFTARE